MKFPSPVSVSWMSTFINATTAGNTNASILGINEIHKVEQGDLVFVDHPKYYATCINSAATCIIINSKDVELPKGKTLLYCASPFDAYAKLVNHFKPFKISSMPIMPSSPMGLNSEVLIASNIGIT